MELKKLTEIVKRTGIEEDLVTCEGEMAVALRKASECDLLGTMFFLQSAGAKYQDVINKIWAKLAAGAISADDAISLRRFIDAGKYIMYQEIKKALEEKCGCRLKEI